MEILGYQFNTYQEKRVTEKLVNAIPVVHTNRYIIDKVVEYRQKHKIKLPDAIILATAKSLNAQLITNNEQDFRNIDKGVKIIVPKELSF